METHFNLSPSFPRSAVVLDGSILLVWLGNGGFRGVCEWDACTKAWVYEK